MQVIMKLTEYLLRGRVAGRNMNERHSLTGRSRSWRSCRVEWLITHCRLLVSCCFYWWWLPLGDEVKEMVVLPLHTYCQPLRVDWYSEHWMKLYVCEGRWIQSTCIPYHTLFTANLYRVRGPLLHHRNGCWLDRHRDRVAQQGWIDLAPPSIPPWPPQPTTTLSTSIVITLTNDFLA